jgi:hypothetical protein
MLSLPEGPRSPCAGLLPSGVSLPNPTSPRPLANDPSAVNRDSSRCAGRASHDPANREPRSGAVAPRAIAVLGDGTAWEPETIALYVEVIQTIPERQSVWARPLVLCDRSTGTPVPYDVRTEADLIWPSERLRWAEDVEALPWLAALEPVALEPTALEPANRNAPEPAICRGMARSQFQAIVRRLWQAHLPTPSS